jgi:hypothetical protein
MVCPRVDKICEAELVYAMKPLELRYLEQGQGNALQSDATMDGIVDDLVVCQRLWDSFSPYKHIERR